MYTLERNFLTIGMLWFLGLTVLGLPLVILLLLFRGFTIGFTVGLLVMSRPGDGLLLVLLGILPANMIFIPAVALIGAAAIGFSSWLIMGRASYGGRNTSLGQMLTIHTGIALISFLGAGLAGIVDAYVTPWLLTLIFI